MVSRSIQIAPGVTVGRGSPLLIIAGPCQIESREHSLMIGRHLKQLCAELQLGFVFKASFDKANRTSLAGARGPGIESGLAILKEVRDELRVPVLTDVHSSEQAERAAQVVDIIQTPAFLCRQTDLLIAAGKTGKVVNVKKGQFLHPSDMKFVAEKIASTGNEKILLCERGASFGYRDLVVDMRSFPLMAKTGFPVIFDATHSVQSMGGEGGSSGGSREFIPVLAKGAVACGVDGLFLECHENPSRAPSDGPSMIPLEEMKPLLQSLAAVRTALRRCDPTH